MPKPKYSLKAGFENVNVQNCFKKDENELFSIFMITGLIWTEIKQLWDEGAEEYVHDMWNILDFVTNSLYIATLTLRVIAYLQVRIGLDKQKFLRVKV